MNNRWLEAQINSSYEIAKKESLLLVGLCIFPFLITAFSGEKVYPIPVSIGATLFFFWIHSYTASKVREKLEDLIEEVWDMDEDSKRKINNRIYNSSA